MKKTVSLFLAAVLCLIMASGCGSQAEASPAAGSAVTSAAAGSAVTSAAAVSSASSPASTAAAVKPSEDRSGNKITLPDKVDKIVSMSPSATEMLDDLGLIGRVVACDTQSPKYVQDLPADIPQFDMMSPDNEKIVALAPDLVITSGMSSTGGEDAFKSVRDAGICVADIPSSTSIKGIQEDIRFVADCTGAGEKGNEIIADMQKSIDRVSAIGSKITDKKTVLYELSDSPSIYSFEKNTYLDEMLSLIGAKNVMDSEEGWISVTDEAAVAANPDVILTSSDMSKDPVGDILKLKGWENVTAVKNSAVAYINNDSAMIPSEKIVEALEEMAVSVYPDQYEEIAKELVGNGEV